ncbi:hypothetical protein TIFTF001_028257 [Ficus carica]|uniref:Uncharacterized protein n=1 Tax=Ficus carica TaxID=3494 RepID=A0AA88DPM0_FICCA|nr:hypothetical protein TIFTF001_028257 [Ficus carica]
MPQSSFLSGQWQTSDLTLTTRLDRRDGETKVAISGRRLDVSFYCDLQTTCVSRICDYIAVVEASEALRTISSARQCFASSIAICRRHARISDNGATANALESFRTHSLAIWRRRQKQRRRPPLLSVLQNGEPRRSEGNPSRRCSLHNQEWSLLPEADARATSSATETAGDLVAGDCYLSLGGIQREYRRFDEVAKSRSQGFNQNVAREESVVGEDDDLGELEEAGARGRVGDTELMPRRKIVILDRNSHDLCSIGTAERAAAIVTFPTLGENG